MKYLIIYDIQASNIKEYNRIKRRFYYHLRKEKFNLINKSVILLSKNEIRNLILLIKDYKPYIRSYLITAQSIEKIK